MTKNNSPKNNSRKVNDPPTQNKMVEESLEREDILKGIKSLSYNQSLLELDKLLQKCPKMH